VWVTFPETRSGASGVSDGKEHNLRGRHGREMSSMPVLNDAAAASCSQVATVYNFTRESLDPPNAEAHIRGPNIEQKLRAAVSRTGSAVSEGLVDESGH
jgi:hypothetical protein